jgi:SAM-dependent methyltransferase
MLGYTSERLDPLLIPAKAASDRARLDLHVERYRLAAEYVREAHVVDCACGTGFGSAALIQAGARSVDGVDLDREALEFARSRHALPGITFFEADALRFVPSLVPSVWVSVDTMERLPNPVAYVNHVAQLLPQGGRFIVSVPVTVTTDSDQHHLHDFTRESFRALLRAHGFKEERMLEQRRRFTFVDLLSRSPGLRPREHRQGLLAFYARRPRVLGQRVARTFTKGFVHEYLTVVAVKS